MVKLHPLVLDAAAYGVPSELSEDDVMVAVVVRPGEVLAPVDLVAFCAERMARHMLPRYVDLVPELPRTPTEKVEKAVLRSRGITQHVGSEGRGLCGLTGAAPRTARRPGWVSGVGRRSGRLGGRLGEGGVGGPAIAAMRSCMSCGAGTAPCRRPCRRGGRMCSPVAHQRVRRRPLILPDTCG